MLTALRVENTKYPPFRTASVRTLIKDTETPAYEPITDDEFRFVPLSQDLHLEHS